MRSHNSLKVFLAVGVFVIFSQRACPASQTTNWQLAPPAIGDWGNAAEWSSGVPTNSFGDLATINNGGTAQITQNASAYVLSVGSAANDSGNLIQSGSFFDIYSRLYVGENGNGTFDFQAGQFHGGDVLVAAFPGSKGTLKIEDGSFKPGYFFVGRRTGIAADGGMASVLQTGGTVEVFYAALTVSGDHSKYELKSGTVKALDQIVQGSGVGDCFIQSGGTNDAHNSSGGGYYSGALRVGVEADNLATYELSGGNLWTNATDVGAYRGTGKFVQTGGVHHVYGSAGIAGMEMSSGSYELRGGQWIIDQALQLGTQGAGELSIYGSAGSIQMRDLMVGNSGEVSFSIDPSGISAVVATRNASISGALKILDNGAPFREFLVMSAGASLAISTATIQLPGPDWSWRQDGGKLFVNHVPEPRSIAAFIVGLFALCCTRLRRAPTVVCNGNCAPQ